ncbi:MAG TPA: hypothetical protein VK633_01915 [Verrucomicrobiae bacterium]|nr:hypothetical protein [Verrucomicrobiae bacterium]
MNGDYSKLRQEQRGEHEQRLTPQEQTATESREFKTVEELLRYDSEENPLPAEVGERLSSSIGSEAKPVQPWYKNLLGG